MAKRKPGDSPKKRGRPRKQITQKQVDDLIALQATKAEIAAALGVHRDTLTDRIKKWTGDKEIDYSTYAEEKKGVGRVKLRKMFFQMAAKQPSVLIFMGKNYLGMSDTITMDINNVNDEYKDIPTESLKAALAAIAAPEKNDS